MTICAACSEENPEHARFCLACGRALAEEPSREERKVVSVLFVDLVGFTGRSDRADPEDVRALLRPYHAQLKQDIERFGGTVEKFIGDAVMAVFGAPVAHEDDAERAVRAGLRILEGLPAELTVRAAVATGEAVVSLSARPEMGEGIVAGDVVNTASRLQGTAPAGSLVVGEATYRATSRAVEYEPLEPVTVKGKAGPVALWRAVRARSRLGVDLEPAARTPFVGRRHELALLKETFARAEREPSVQLATVVGEPGVGKSRLVAEFRQFIDDRPGLVSWKQGRCLPYGEGITFWALGEIVKAQTGILESDSPEEARTKLEDVVSDESDREWLVARLAPLVGVAAHGEAGQEESFTAWRRFLESLAAARPLVAVFEDLQWADEAMLDFIEHVVDWVTDVPLLIVCTSRPELYERRPGWGGGKRNSTTISPAPLTEEETDELLEALLPSVLPAETRTAVLERAEGNPLFAEEFARLVVERADVQVPETVQALIAARLDTLDADRKALLQDAAVLGKVFWAGALAAIGGRQDVSTAVRDLVRRDLIRPARTSSVGGEEEFAFWHGLVRDVAYQQIPRAERARRHRAAAEWIERIAGDRVADHAEILAHHYGEALEYARAAGDETEELGRRGQRFAVMAGDRAMHLDVQQAYRFYRRALEHIPDDDAGRPPLLFKVAEAAHEAGDSTQSVRYWESAVAAYHSAGDAEGEASSLARLGRVLWWRGEGERAEQLHLDALALVEGRAASHHVLEVYTRLAGHMMVSGRAERGAEWAEKAIALAEELGVPDLLPGILNARGNIRTVLGDIGGLDDLREGIRLGRELGLALPPAITQLSLSDALWDAEGPASALASYAEAEDFARRRGLVEPAVWTQAETVWPLFDSGRWDEVLAAAEEVLDWDREHRAQPGLIVLTYKVRVLALRGEVPTAANFAGEMLDRARASGDPQVLVPALVTAGELELAEERPESAVRLMEELMEATRDRGASARGRYLADAVRISVAGGRSDLAAALQSGVPKAGTLAAAAEPTAAATVAEAAGEAARAAELYREGANRWRERGSVYQLAHALLGLWRCAGDEAALAEAREIFDSLGAQAATEAPLGPAPASRAK